jgi:peptide/nickel transport system permease protein
VAHYVAGRLASAVGVMFALVTVVFFAVNVIGNPIELLVNPDFVSPAEVDALVEAAGYNRPLHERYVEYLGGAVRGDFGNSALQGRAASEIVIERVPATALLGASAIAITIVFSVPLALIAARRSGWIDTSITAIATALASLPSFWLGIGLIFLFAVLASWLPTGGYGSWKQLVMPALALSALPLGFTTLVLMAAIRGEYGAQYVTVARSKGLSERLVAWRHVLRNAALVMATQIGLLVISLMNGTVLIEAVFAWPGLGQVTLQAVQSRDLPVVMAAVVYLGLIVTLVNLAVDLAYARLDPRVRLT